MRLSSGVLTAIGIGAVSLALADAPATPPTPSSTPVAPTAAQTPAPAAAPDTPAEDVQLDRHLRSEGYKVEMHDGQKKYCRKEDVIGTRLGAGTKTCSTAEQLKITEAQAHEAAERAQRQQSSGPRGQ
ncbi:MAG: hypothetical protein JSS29_15710 [Proteobacteria bacterium]|nr:hypothetical protein [Pseudomonadota bacterium]